MVPSFLCNTHVHGGSFFANGIPRPFPCLHDGLRLGKVSRARCRIFSFSSNLFRPTKRSSLINAAKCAIDGVTSTL